MENHEKIAVVIPSHNRKAKTLDCIERLQSLYCDTFVITVIVADDGSTDGTAEAICKKFPEVVLLSGNGSLWWSGATNLGVRYALNNNFHYVLTLNDDVQFNVDMLKQLYETSRSTHNVIACCVVCHSRIRNIIISAGRYAKGLLGYNYSSYMRGSDISNLPDEDYESDIESGYAMLIPAHVFRKIGCFDDKKFPHHMGDMDFVLRAKKYGITVMVNPRAFLYTEIGENYLHNLIVAKSLRINVKSLFDIKSTINIRTRWNFCRRHTPYNLGLVSFMFFVSRIAVLMVFKLLLPRDMLMKMIKKRRKLSI